MTGDLGMVGAFVAVLYISKKADGASGGGNTIMTFEVNQVCFYEPNISLSDLTRYHLESKALQGFRMTETRLPSNLRIPKHSHEFGSFCLVLSGSFTERSSRSEKDYGISDMIYTPPGEVHADQFHWAGGHCFYLEFSPRSLDLARQYSLHIEEPADLKGGIASFISMRLYQEFNEMDQSSPLVVEGLGLELMAEVSKRQVTNEKTNHPRWLRKVEDRLHAEFAAKLTLDDIAREGKIHPVHLARTFRRIKGCTVGEYLRRLRIKSVMEQLTTTEMSLAEIALTTGFADQAHFSRTFKKQTGMTPAEFRNIFSSRKSRSKNVSN